MSESSSAVGCLRVTREPTSTTPALKEGELGGGKVELLLLLFWTMFSEFMGV